MDESDFAMSVKLVTMRATGGLDDTCGGDIICSYYQRYGVPIGRSKGKSVDYDDWTFPLEQRSYAKR